MNNQNKQLNIAHVLISSSKYLSTKEICERAECDRKTVYNAIDSLECAGFLTDIKVGTNSRGHKCNYYNIIGY